MPTGASSETSETGPEPSAAKSNGTQSAASRLHRLADDTRFATRRRDISLLASALENGRDDFEGWERVDLHRAFSPGSTIHVEHGSRFERGLGIAAGFTVFLPLAWTWYTLRHAAEAYDQMLGAGTADGQSFLQLWVSGFDGILAPEHTLPAVTVVSLVLIGLAATLFAAHRFVADRAARVDDRAFVDAEAELASALADSERAIGQSLVADGSSIESVVRKSVSKLARAHESMEAASKAMTDSVEKTQSALEGTLAQVQGLTQSLTGSANQIGSAAGDVSEASKTTETAARETLERLSQTIAGTTARFQQANVDATIRYAEANAEASRQVADQAAKTAEDLVRVHAEATRGIREAQETLALSSAEELRGARDAMSGAVQDLRDSVAALSGVHTATANGLDRMNKVTADLPHRLASEAQDALGRLNNDVQTTMDAVRTSVLQLQRSLERIDASLTSNESATQAQVSELTQTRDVLAALSSRYLEPMLQEQS